MRGHVVAVGGMLTLLTPAMALVLHLAAKSLGLPRQQLRAAAAAVAFGTCYLAALALRFLDPGRFGEWFLD